MCTVKELIQANQPEMFARLAAIKYKKQEEPMKINAALVRDLMRHDAYTRTRGGVRQIRFGKQF